jgi:predicted naringenin-chalcone synthase
MFDLIHEARGALTKVHGKASPEPGSRLGPMRSSPFVYFVLQAALRDNAPGGWWGISLFGTGFCCRSALLNVA